MRKPLAGCRYELAPGGRRFCDGAGPVSGVCSTSARGGLGVMRHRFGAEDRRSCPGRTRVGAYASDPTGTRRAPSRSRYPRPKAGRASEASAREFGQRSTPVSCELAWRDGSCRMISHRIHTIRRVEDCNVTDPPQRLTPYRNGAEGSRSAHRLSQRHGSRVRTCVLPQPPSACWRWSVRQQPREDLSKGL